MRSCIDTDIDPKLFVRILLHFYIERYRFFSSRDTMLKLWNADTGKEVKSLGGHTGSITSVFLLPKRDISSCGERVVLIFLCLCFCLCLSIYFSLYDLTLERIPLTTMFNSLFVLQPL